MQLLPKIGIVLVVIGATISLAGDENQKPDATLRLSGGSVAAGVGFSWGSGILTFRGREYPVKVSGLSLGKAGITDASARGEVYRLKKLEDFNGHYNAAGAGAARAAELGLHK